MADERVEAIASLLEVGERVPPWEEVRHATDPFWKALWDSLAAAGLPEKGTRRPPIKPDTVPDWLDKIDFLRVPEYGSSFGLHIRVEVQRKRHDVIRPAGLHLGLNLFASVNGVAKIEGEGLGDEFRRLKGKVHREFVEKERKFFDPDRANDPQLDNDMSVRRSWDAGMVRGFESLDALAKEVAQAFNAYAVVLKRIREFSEFKKVAALFSGSGEQGADVGIGMDKSMSSSNMVEELKRHLEATCAVVLQGPPGTGKTRLALQLVHGLAGGDLTDFKESSDELKKSRWTNLLESPDDHPESSGVVWEIVQLHPGYAYEDLVRGVTTGTGEGIRFVTKDGLLPKLAEFATANLGTKDKPGTKVVLILDEINRCSLSSVLGELILVLEKGYRQFPVKLAHDAPDGGSATLTLPENLWILGTMNTADRSIAMVDFAVRRRFRFIDVLPDGKVFDDFYEDLGRRKVATTAFKDVGKLVKEERLAIGHSYFLTSPQAEHEEWASNFIDRLVYEVVPLLREYREEGFLKPEETRVLDTLIELNSAQDSASGLLEAVIKMLRRGEV